MNSPRSSVVSEQDAGGSFALVLPDDKGRNCLLCDAEFTNLFRRHHCRQCGMLVCDNCSPQRLRLPKDDMSVGKVRVCNPCADSIAKGHSREVEADLEEKSQIVETLQSQLDSKRLEVNRYKRLFLELMGDERQLEQLGRNPAAGDARSWEAFKEQVEATWSQLQRDAEMQHQSVAQLQSRLEELRAHKDKLDKKDSEASAKIAALQPRVQALEAVQEECKKLADAEDKLLAEVANVRKRVDDMELRRLESQERQNRQQASWLEPQRQPGGRWCCCLGDQARAVPALTMLPEGTVEFMISTGHQDQLIPSGPRRRCEGCQRAWRAACALM